MTSHHQIDPRKNLLALGLAIVLTGLIVLLFSGCASALTQDELDRGYEQCTCNELGCGSRYFYAITNESYSVLCRNGESVVLERHGKQTKGGK